MIVLTNAESPLDDNPTFEQLNSSVALVQWSPPFLWPGSAIDFYNVSIINNGTGTVHFERENASFDDRVVNYTLQGDDQNCTHYTVGILAVTGSASLSTVYVTGGFSLRKCMVNN